MSTRILVLFILLLTIYSISFAQGGDAILQKHIQAIGGEKKWAAIQSLKYETITDMHGVSTKEQKKWVKHKYYRSDIEITRRVASETNTTYGIIVNQNKGWKSLPDQMKPGFQPMDSSECMYYISKPELENPFIDAKAQGQSIQYLETEYFNDKNYHKFLIKYKDGTSEYCYLDPETAFIHMRVSLNTETENVRVYHEYTTTKDGLVLPKRFTTSQGDVFVNQPEVNIKFKPELFQMPKLAK